MNENYMKKFYILYFLFCFPLLFFAQNSGMSFYSDGNMRYILDTASVKRTSNIITCRVIIQKLKIGKVGSNYLTGRIVRQYLLDAADQKLFMLGQIEYDSTYKVINTNDSKVINPKISKHISTDSVATSLALYLNSFFNEKIFSFDEIRTNEIKVTTETRDSLKIAKKDSMNIPDTTKIESPVTNENNISKTEPTVTTESDISFIEVSKEIVPQTYDFENEYNPEGTIFTDGKLYCFQISSWKNRSVAESEVEKLTKKGFNAFIIKANLNGKKGVWYRVRIGYFNSISEAREHQLKVNSR